MFSTPSQIAYLRQTWIQSKTFRRLLIVVLVYFVFRLAIQSIVLAQVLSAGSVASETTLISNDLQIYLAAAQHLQNYEDLYLQDALDRVAVYQYAPAYALLFTAFLGVPFGILSLIHTLLNIATYILLYVWWGRIFHRLGLDKANEMLSWTLPVWLVFAAFWGDLSYLNIYVITTLICTLLIEAVLYERLGWSVLWISILLQAKPYLIFPLAIPLILGRFRFFVKLLALAIVTYGAIVGVTILSMGPSYGWEQHVDYVRFLAEMTANFPWRTPDNGFLGYNHSILQIVFFLLGVTPKALRLATGIKILLLIPLAVVCLRHWLRPARAAGCDVPELSLPLMFALYTGAFIWLDIVWELTLGAAVLAYLLAISNQKGEKILVWAIFLPYALLDFWQVLTFVVLGPDIIASDVYIWTDPSIYFPLVMVVNLTFYAILVKRLWSIPTSLPNRRVVSSQGRLVEVKSEGATSA